jgi:hypothetical protein
MDIDALWRTPPAEDDNSVSSSSDIFEQWRTSGPAAVSSLSKRRQTPLVRRTSISLPRASTERTLQTAVTAEEKAAERQEKELILPTGPRHYNDRAWLEPDIKKIRRDFVSNGIIFPKFQEGLNSYFAKDWSNAKKCFELVLTQRDDGPSLYFLERMAENDGVPPRNFMGYSVEQG